MAHMHNYQLSAIHMLLNADETHMLAAEERMSDQVCEIGDTWCRPKWSAVQHV